MSTLQLRNKLTGRVIAHKRIDNDVSALQKSTIALEMSKQAGIAVKGPYSNEDLYVTEMVGCCCVNKWDLM